MNHSRGPHLLELMVRITRKLPQGIQLSSSEMRERCYAEAGKAFADHEHLIYAALNDLVRSGVSITGSAAAPPANDQLPIVGDAAIVVSEGPVTEHAMASLGIIVDGPSPAELSVNGITFYRRGLPISIPPNEE